MTMRPRPDELETYARLQRAIDALNQLPNALRQSLADRQWAQISLYVEEYAYAAAQPANVPLVATAQTTNLERITDVVVSVPAGATALLQLGSLVMPLPAGTTSFGVNKLIGGADTRALTCNAAGPASLWLFGEQMADNGILAG